MSMDTMTVGRRIQAVLKTRKISQAKFCNDIGVSQETFRKWVKGETEPNRNRIKVVAAYLNCTEEWLRFGHLKEQTGQSGESDTPSESDNDSVLSTTQPPVVGGVLNGLHLATTQAPRNGITWELYVNMIREGVDLSAGLWVEVTDDANSPEINPGDECYIAPGTAKAGTLAVFRTGDGDVVLRRYRAVTSSRFLAVAGNSDYAHLDSVADNLQLVGVVTKHMRTLI